MVDAGRVRRLLDRLRVETARLRRLAERPAEELLGDEVAIAAVQFRFVVAIEVCIDLGQHLIASEGLEAPDTYGDVFVVLAEAGVLPAEQAVTLRAMARFRNRLVHLYDETDEAEVVRALHEDLNDFDRYRQAVARHVMTSAEMRWGEWRVVELTAARVRVRIVPERGAKVLALTWRPEGGPEREWLLQGEPAPHIGYGGTFTDAEMCGWDEMLPTIDACTLADGTALPDHGELWAIPWTVVDEGPDRCTTAVEGRALPYRLERTVAVVGDDAVRLSYALTATGSVPTALLWAAHPQFTAAPGARVELPTEVTEVLDVKAGEPPPVLAWPAAGLDALAAVPPGDGRKWYVPPDVRVGEARLVDPDGTWLRLTWDAEAVPYLGVWADDGAFAASPVVALEPSTGFYDDLSRADAPVLAPGETRRWALTVRLGGP